MCSLVLQKLNNIYEGMFPTLGYYKAEDVGVLSADLLARIDDFARLHTSLYAGGFTAVGRACGGTCDAHSVLAFHNSNKQHIHLIRTKHMKE